MNNSDKSCRAGATSFNNGLVTVSVSRSTVTVNAVAEGNATVTVAARDPQQLKAEQSFTVTAIPHPDRAALVALYRATGGPDWVVSGNWLTDLPLRDWFGVTVDADGRVAEQHLQCINLRGWIQRLMIRGRRTELGRSSTGFRRRLQYRRLSRGRADRP